MRDSLLTLPTVCERIPSRRVLTARKSQGQKRTLTTGHFIRLTRQVRPLWDPKRTFDRTHIVSLGSCIRGSIPNPPNAADSKGHNVSTQCGGYAHCAEYS